MTESDGDLGAETTANAATAPEIDQPSVPSPTDADGPEDDLPSSTEVDTGLRTMFWKLVFLYKFALLGLTLGALLLVFDAGPDVGAELLAGSLALFGYTIYRTKRGKERVEAGEFDDEKSEGDEGPNAGGPTASREGEQS